MWEIPTFIRVCLQLTGSQTVGFQLAWPGVRAHSRSSGLSLGQGERLTRIGPTDGRHRPRGAGRGAVGGVVASTPRGGHRPQALATTRATAPSHRLKKGQPVMGKTPLPPTAGPALSSTWPSGRALRRGHRPARAPHPWAFSEASFSFGH